VYLQECKSNNNCICCDSCKHAIQLPVYVDRLCLLICCMLSTVAKHKSNTNRLLFNCLPTEQWSSVCLLTSFLPFNVLSNLYLLTYLYTRHCWPCALQCCAQYVSLQNFKKNVLCNLARVRIRVRIRFGLEIYKIAYVQFQNYAVHSANYTD